MSGDERHGHPGDPGEDELSAERPTELPAELSGELLADLHAGVFDDAEGAAGIDVAALRRAAADDPRAVATLHALDATVDDLAALPGREVPMPAAVGDRITAAIAAEAHPSHVVPLPGASPAPGRDPDGVRRRHIAGWAGGAALLAAAVLVGFVVIAGLPRAVPGIPSAGDPRGAATDIDPSGPLTLTGNDLDAAIGHALGRHDLGPLSDPGRLRACLDANNAPRNADPLGATQVTLDGRRGVLLILPTEQIAVFRLLVVGADCTHDNPATLADHHTNR